MATVNRYSGFDFPEYKFEEYPKWVKHNGGNHIVRDAEEEKALLALKAPTEREILEFRANELDVAFSKDWPDAKLAAFVRKAESDLEFAEYAKEENDPVDEKEALIEQAKKLGVEVDKRWGVEKLKAAVA